MKRIFTFGLSLLGILALLLIFGAAPIIDYLWFSALGFQEIFLTRLSTKIALFAIGFLLSFAFFAINIGIAKRKKAIFTKKFFFLGGAIASLFVGGFLSRQWMVVLQYLNRSSFGLTDPILGKEVSFYVFTLPFFDALVSFLFSVIIITGIGVAVYYLQQFLKEFFTQEIDPTSKEKRLRVRLSVFAQDHLLILASFLFLLIALKNYLAQYAIMFSQQGVVVGAGFTDVTIILPVIQILMVLAVVIAISFYGYIFFVMKRPSLRKHHLLLYVIGLYLVITIIGQGIVPSVVQSLKVEPDELSLEKPYIDNNIQFTRIAYGLDDVVIRDFPVTGNVSRSDIEKSRETIEAIRILDYRPLEKTYQQTQGMRLYYDLAEIDIDRYMIDGTYTPVMLSPRELDQRRIMQSAQTWVNTHMVYTHGHGVVMSPVNEVTAEGLPQFLIQDIPPRYTVEEPNIEIRRPGIYFGELDNPYVVVNTGSKEFDYPKSNTNEYTTYNATSGVQLSHPIIKLLMAIRFNDIKLLFSSEITEQSSILFRRDIRERVSQLMPFLKLDYDPYITIADGKLYWIQDAYTTTGNFPYSEKYSSDLNYIRNAVKVVVDAYTGDVTFYVADQEDPLIETYRKIFPESFESIDDMPAELHKHIRYPENLFDIQSSIYSTYHMNDTNVFYNKEDAWEIPKEIYGTGQQIRMEPYYAVMELSEEKGTEFIIMLPFTPLRKDNMVSWLAGRSDEDQYGNLVLYRFPKDTLVYGPSQIEARIDQDSEISQQLSLWDQQGSRVTRGNLLVIPIQDSILYVEPLYIQSEQGQLPELKRIFVSDGNKVVMERTLEQAIESLLGVSQEQHSKADTRRPIEQADFSLAVVRSLYNELQDALREGNWTLFGEKLNELGDEIKKD